MMEARDTQSMTKLHIKRGTWYITVESIFCKIISGSDETGVIPGGMYRLLNRISMSILVPRVTLNQGDICN